MVHVSFKRMFGYYPFTYPTKFLLGCLKFNSLKVRGVVDEMTTACKLIHDHTDASYLYAELCQLFVPNNYYRFRKHALFNVLCYCTVVRSTSSIPRMLVTLNALVDLNPILDLFADEWKTLMLECFRLLVVFQVWDDRVIGTSFSFNTCKGYSETEYYNNK